MQVIQIITGLLLLFFGRKLFWLFAGTVGFYTGYIGASRFFGNQPMWWMVLIATMAGVSSAILALSIQSLAVTVASFLAGGYLLSQFVQRLGIDLGPFSWFPFIAGGLAGGFLVVFVLEWALILLSAFLGAAMASQSLGLNPTITILAFLILLLLGGGLQVEMLRREDTPPPGSTE